MHDDVLGVTTFESLPDLLQHWFGDAPSEIWVRHAALRWVRSPRDTADSARLGVDLRELEGAGVRVPLRREATKYVPTCALAPPIPTVVLYRLHSLKTS